jgi:hypothetical protein
VGNHLVEAGDGQDAQHRGAGGHQHYLAALGPGALVRAHEGVKPGGIAKLGPGHVDHQRLVRYRVEQCRAEPGGVGDIDLFGCRHHRHASNHLDREPGVRHRQHPPLGCEDTRRTGRALAPDHQQGDVVAGRPIADQGLHHR